MPQIASMLRVMIASPSDVPQERQIVRTVIHEWNALHARDRSTILLPVGWETDTAPDMSDRPQAVISKQILSDCDLMIAIFWTHLGSPTGKASSGSVEEIEEHIAAGRHAMLYFSSAPVALNSVDPSNYAALKEFKAACFKRGLVHEYNSLAQFRDDFSRHLTKTIIDKFSFPGVPATAPPRLPSIDLSTDAQMLLQEAAETAEGVIMMIQALVGTTIEVAGTTFVREGDSRSEAKWRSALNELYDARLVEDRTGKGELFFVTNRGYDAAALLLPIEREPIDPRE